MHLHVHNSSVPTWLLLKDRLQQAVRLLRPADVVVESIDRMRAPNSPLRIRIAIGAIVCRSKPLIRGGVLWRTRGVWL